MSGFWSCSGVGMVEIGPNGLLSGVGGVTIFRSVNLTNHGE
jgi:hypothetical protein